MNNISSPSVFKFEESTSIRVIMHQDEPWFVAKDVCDVLGLTNSRKAVTQLDPDEVTKSYIMDSKGRRQEICIISESGLYALVIRSNKPNARKFRKWITSEVLSTIRKTGNYTVQPELPLESVPAAPAEFSRLRYQGVEVIPTDELRKRLGITSGQLSTWLTRYKPLAEGVDVFRINGVTDKLAMSMLKAGCQANPNLVSVCLYTRSGFAKAAARFGQSSVQPEVIPEVRAEISAPKPPSNEKAVETQVLYRRPEREIALGLAQHREPRITELHTLLRDLLKQGHPNARHALFQLEELRYTIQELRNLIPAMLPRLKEYTNELNALIARM